MDIKVFRRVEKKYLLPKKQYNSLMKELKKYIEVDTYDYSTICNRKKFHQEETGWINYGR